MGESKNNEVNCSGMQAISDAFDRIYQKTLDNTKQYGVLISWALGGPDPLDQIRIYDGGEYWHFVSFGLSELYDKESENKELSGYGMEFTVKLKKYPGMDEEEEIKGIVGILQELARITFRNGEVFQPYEFIYTGQKQGMDTQQKSKITGFITVPEPMLEKINTPNGEVQFVELVGATDFELQAILQRQLRVKGLYKMLGSDWTDYQRQSVPLQSN